MRVRFTRKAVNNLDDIAGYLVERNPSAAQRVREKILEALDILVRFPDAGKRQTTEQVRKLVVRKYPYLVYYSVNKDAGEIIILSIQHPAREREYDDS